jgi:hypothetical protein
MRKKGSLKQKDRQTPKGCIDGARKKMKLLIVLIFCESQSGYNYIFAEETNRKTELKL